VRRWTLLIAGAALWLFLAAIPALADGGPHIASVNSGSSTLTADSCAGCHRAHTAQGPMLLNAVDEEALCLSCHGSTGIGATTDVARGLQYATLSNAAGAAKAGTILGALRNGGFEEASINAHNPMRLTYIRNNIGEISTRPKVGVLANPEPVKSAHMDIHNNSTDSLAPWGIAWGNGAGGTSPSVKLSCASCHNPHGNGQYRILNPVPNGSNVTPGSAVSIASTAINNERIVTTTNHDFIVGSRVTISGNTNTAATYWDEAADPPALVTGGIINGTFTVASVSAATGTANVRWLTLAGVDITTAGNTGTIAREADVKVTDSPMGTPTAGGAYPTKNYTVTQVKGTVGTDASFMLFASDVADAQSATPTKTWPTGTYTATSGDYLRRTVPWNPTLTDPACDPTVNPSTSGNFQVTANATACATINDAPNGRPAAWSSTNGAQRDAVAFNDEMTAWCSSCHTRYYAVSLNPNPGTLQGPPATEVIIVSSNGSTDTITTGLDNPNLAAGDAVKIEGHGDPLLNGNWFVVNPTSTGSPTQYSFQVSQTSGGVVVDFAGSAAIPNTPNGFVTRTSQAIPPATAASWWFSRPGDNTYKYQHQTTSNRTCTTCHVAHGSNAVMDADPNTAGNQGFSPNVPYPDGVSTSVSSRLLKVDNRGTCQMCHEPTGTIEANVLLPSGATPVAP
jgi:predicted CXXCH cytochrome family protein